MPRNPKNKCRACGKGSSKRWYKINKDNKAQVSSCFKNILNPCENDMLCSGCHRNLCDHKLFNNTYEHKVNKHGKKHVHCNKQAISDHMNDSKFINLRVDIILFILSFLDFTSLVHLSCVNKKFNNICHDGNLWKYKSIQSFHLNADSVIYLDQKDVDWYLWYRMMKQSNSVMSSSIVDLEKDLREYKEQNLQLASRLENVSAVVTSLSNSKNKKLTALEEKIFRSIYKRKVHDGKVTVSGERGRPITLQVVRKPEKDSDEASNRTNRDRVKSMEKNVMFISSIDGNSNSAKKTLMTKYVKKNKEEFTSYAENAGIKITCKFTPDEAAALKKSMTFGLWRLVKRALKKVTGMDVLGPEKKMRDAIKRTEFQYEAGSFITSKGKKVMFVRVTNAREVIHSLIQSIQRSGLMKSYANISRDLLLMLLSGDKGGSSTKLLLQIVNTIQNQSVRHAKVLAIFDGDKDNRECIEHVFGPVISALYQINIAADKIPNNLPITPIPNIKLAKPFKLLLEIDDENLVMSPECVYCVSDESFNVTCSHCQLMANNNEVRRKVGYHNKFVGDECSCDQFASFEIINTGDWEWLARLLGLSGPNGTYFCPYCYVKLDDIRKGVPHAPYIFEKYKKYVPSDLLINFSARLVEEIRHHQQLFKLSNTSRDNLSRFFNCEFSPLIPVTGPVIDFVSMMSLHLKLGIGKLLADFFEEKAILFDNQIRTFKGVTDSNQSQLFIEEAELIALQEQCQERIRALCEALNDIEEEINEMIAEFPQYHSKNERVFQDKSIEAIAHRRAVAEKKSDAKPLHEELKVEISQSKMIDSEYEKIKEKINAGLGPFQKKLRDVLNEENLQRQVYHSKALVGNDVNKLMDKEVIKKITECFEPIKVTSIRGSIAQICTKEYQQKLLTLHQKIAMIFEFLSLTRPLCKHEVSILTVRCYSLGNWLPVNFPDLHQTRKFHVLVTHVPEKASRRATIGMEAEQCIEAIHPVFNDLKKAYSSVSNGEDQLALMIKRHWHQSDPSFPDFETKGKKARTHEP